MQIRYPNIDKDLGTTATLFNFIPRHKSQYRKGGDDTKGEASWGKQAAIPEKFRNMRVYCAQDSIATLISKPGLEKALMT